MQDLPPSVLKIAKRRLAFLNELANYDEGERIVCFPTAFHNNKTQEFLAKLKTHITGKQIETDTIWSFDIDLTISMPEDTYNAAGSIDVHDLIRLKNKYILGTCSDRPPSEQRAAMHEIGLHPDFCIPKEMLKTLRQMFSRSHIIHVGDDKYRDKLIAEQTNVAHYFPDEFTFFPIQHFLDEK